MYEYVNDFKKCEYYSNLEMNTYFCEYNFLEGNSKMET